MEWEISVWVFSGLRNHFSPLVRTIVSTTNLLALYYWMFHCLVSLFCFPKNISLGFFLHQTFSGLSPYFCLWIAGGEKSFLFKSSHVATMFCAFFQPAVHSNNKPLLPFSFLRNHLLISYFVAQNQQNKKCEKTSKQKKAHLMPSKKLETVTGVYI